MSVQQVAAQATFPLRQQVLRPHESDELGGLDSAGGDGVHFAVVDEDRVIGTGSVRPEAPTWSGIEGPSWRLRGMATDPERRSQGVGGAILETVIEYVRTNGGGLLWCNARQPAIKFYERAGFVTCGEGWDEPIIGPHVAMQLIVDPAPVA